MRSTLVPLALAGLLLAGSGSATMAQSTGQSAGEDTRAEAYVDSMTATMKAWADKVGDWTARQVDAASDATAKAGERTEEALDDAWSAVKRDWQQLKEASADGYEVAQERFEQSLDSLEKAWDERDDATTSKKK